MRRTRKNLFETNSSSTHAYSVNISDYTSITRYDEEERDDVYLDENDVINLLDSLPESLLEEALKRRKNGTKEE